jgi:hypothetical protein
VPFTASHVAAALPFLRLPLLPAALVIGTMAPDLPYYVPGGLGVPREWTHSPFGIVTIDLVLGAVLFALWHGFVREPAIDLAPAPIRARMPAGSRSGRPAGWGRGRTLGVLIASLVIGAATHVVWDSFTHPGPVVDALPLLDERWGPLLVHKWIQHGSSVIGVVALVIAAVHWLRTTPVSPAGKPPRTVSRVAPATRIVCWTAVGLAGILGGLIVWVAGMTTGFSPLEPRLVFRVARVVVASSGAVALAVVALWYLRFRVGRMSRGDR